LPDVGCVGFDELLDSVVRVDVKDVELGSSVKIGVQVSKSLLTY
jgi:hypothetical protein